MKYLNYFIQFILTILFFILFKILGPSLSSRLSGKIFEKIGPFFRSKKTIHSNIKRVYPNIEIKEITNIANLMWNNYGRVFAEFMFMHEFRSGKLSQNIEIVGQNILENIKSIFEKHGISYFSPKDENLCDNDASESMQDQIFKGNIHHLHECDWMLCNTRNKDMGSIFEAGYMNCLEKPIVYFCDGLPDGAQFNLMLAASGEAVCTSFDDLAGYLYACKEKGGQVMHRRYGGKIE